jgi:hypothetical protein
MVDRGGEPPPDSERAAQEALAAVDARSIGGPLDAYVEYWATTARMGLVFLALVPVMVLLTGDASPTPAAALSLVGVLVSTASWTKTERGRVAATTGLALGLAMAASVAAWFTLQLEVPPSTNEMLNLQAIAVTAVLLLVGALLARAYVKGARWSARGTRVVLAALVVPALLAVVLGSAKAMRCPTPTEYATRLSAAAPAASAAGSYAAPISGVQFATDCGTAHGSTAQLPGGPKVPLGLAGCSGDFPGNSSQRPATLEILHDEAHGWFLVSVRDMFGSDSAVFDPKTGRAQRANAIALAKAVSPLPWWILAGLVGLATAGAASALQRLHARRRAASLAPPPVEVDTSYRAQPTRVAAAPHAAPPASDPPPADALSWAAIAALACGAGPMLIALAYGLCF